MSYIDVKEVNLLDENGQVINPAEDESVILLRRLLFMVQSLGSRDAAGTLRVNIANQDIFPTIQNTVQYGGVAANQQIADWARTAYNTGIRSNIIFS
jgi:hypothetical protein